MNSELNPNTMLRLRACFHCLTEAKSTDTECEHCSRPTTIVVYSSLTGRRITPDIHTRSLKEVADALRRS